MFNSPKEVRVDVILNPDNVALPPDQERPDGYALPFRLQSDDIEVGPDNFIEFHNQSHPGFYIQFYLKDPHNSGYRFPDDPKEAIWVEKAQPQGPVPCPVRESHWPQFKGKEVKPGNKVLVVRNLNQSGHQSRFGYTLRVTLNPNVHPIKFANLDPGGDNANGGYGFSYNAAFLTIAATSAAIAAGATLALLGVFGFLNC